MAHYTMELRTIVKSRDIFKSVDYELYNNSYKQKFEEKFIKRFYFREIGSETIGRFLIYLETTLNEIMPYYTQLYKTTTYIYDPLLNYDLTEEIIREVTDEKSSSSSTGTTGDSRSYDTPVIRNDFYDYKKSPSFIASSEDNSNYSGRANNKSNEKNKRMTKGNIGVMSTQDLIKKERELIINIDKMILDELEILFMQVF